MCVVSTSSSCGHNVRHSLSVLITYTLLTMVCQRIEVNVNGTMFIPCLIRVLSNTMSQSVLSLHTC